MVVETEMTKPKRIMIHVACNDPDNGVFAEKAQEIAVGCDFLHLEARWNAPRFLDFGTFVRLAGKRWLIDGGKEWVGNWCWNGYWFEIPTAVQFLDWLHGRNLFQCDCGEERLYDMWESPTRFSDLDKEYLVHALVEA